jgi:hypothetical protein
MSKVNVIRGGMAVSARLAAEAQTFNANPFETFGVLLEPTNRFPSLSSLGKLDLNAPSAIDAGGIEFHFAGERAEVECHPREFLHPTWVELANSKAHHLAN